jgi:hypothetical protein
MDYDDNNFRHCRNEGRISYMSFNYVAKLPIPMEVKKQFPISDELKARFLPERMTGSWW